MQPSAVLNLTALCREPPAPPVRVEIANASEFSKDTVLRVQRDEDGKLTGATAVKV